METMTRNNTEDAHQWSQIPINERSGCRRERRRTKGWLLMGIATLVISAALVALSACNSSSTIPPSGGVTDFDSFRNFAQQLQTALVSQDTSFFASRIQEISVVCTGNGEPRGACVNRPPGTVLRGLPSDISGANALQIIPPADYSSTMQTWLASARPDLSDQFGSGAATLYAVATDTSGDADSYLAILSAIYSGRGRAERQALVLRFQIKDGDWLMVAEERAVNPGTPEQWLLGNCKTCHDEWERWTPIALS